MQRTRWPEANALVATPRWIRCGTSGRTSSTSTTATTSPPAATTAVTRAPRRCRRVAFGDYKATGSSILDLGVYLTRVTDRNGLPLFGVAVTQQLCFYANSAPCSTTDAEFRRVVRSLTSSNYNYGTLLKEFFASPLVTGAVAHRDLRGQRRAGEHHAARSLLRGPLEPPRQDGPLAQAGGPHVGPVGHREDRVQRRRRRLQPWRGVAGDPFGSDAVLQLGDGDAVREHRHAGR